MPPRSKFNNFDLEKRRKLKLLLDNGLNYGQIAQELGFHRTTISDEIQRNRAPSGEYDPDYANEKALENKKRKGRSPILLRNNELAQYISELILKDKLSPEKTIEAINADKRFQVKLKSVHVIYSAIDRGYIPNVTRDDLGVNSKIMTMFSKGRLVVPKWIREQLDLLDGDLIHWELSENGKIVIEKQF